jgi:tRNA-splicing ligase RtcB (3'-phosphate/5'-hydroxy nucleic acid ligase)
MDESNVTTPEALVRLSPNLWELPAGYKPDMQVPARIYASDPLIASMDSGVFDQISNVACLPGIVDAAYCMPDGHWGYGFPIGGVAAMDVDAGGVISPGGIGFDINCGMRLVRTDLTHDEVRPHLRKLVDRLFERVPAGVGSAGFIRLSADEFRDVAERGARWCLDRGLGWPEDLTYTEEGGCIQGADADCISTRAIERGLRQIGTLGSGNHYLEIQVAEQRNVLDPDAARAYGIDRDDQIVIMFHCGSRGFGHQVASDYLRSFLKVMGAKYGISVRDRELAAAPFHSPEGQQYFKAMNCAINLSFANRQVILHRIREVFAEVLKRDPRDLGMNQVYDVAHNTAKLEQHEIDGRMRRLLVHRKGATRAFAPGMDDVPEAYQQVGQPVIIGGSMETGSFLLRGVPEGRAAFYSTAHGSGRTMSRREAKRTWHGAELQQQMEQRGIYVRSAGYAGLAEEAGGAYKDIEAVIAAVRDAGLAAPVARLRPIGNVKG